MIAYEDLLSVCVRYSGSDYYVDEIIPPKKLAKARMSFPIPDYDRVVALVDATALGSNKHGLAVCESGIRWSNDWTTDSEQTYLPWGQFATVTIKAKGFFDVQLGKNNLLNTSGSSFKKKDLLGLLSELQGLARSPSTSSSQDWWSLAIGGQQFGPYDVSTVKSMVEEGRVNPSETWVWKDGMPDWERFAGVPALASLLRPAPHPPTPPPLPGSAPPSPEVSRSRVSSQGSDGPVARAHTVTYGDLLRVCVKYGGNGYYVGETIPEKKLANARSSFSIPDTERVVALLDATVFGSAKDGLAVCTGGIYWHNMMTDPKRRLWTAFASAEIKPKGGSDVELGEGNVFQGVVAMDRDDTLRLLSEIQALVRTSYETQEAADGATSPRTRQGARATHSHRPAGRGATASPRPDLNRAPVDDLLSLPAISLPNGQKLVRERERRGGFDTVEEAGHFLGLQPHQVERLKQRVTLEPYEGASPSGGRVIDF